ncbi:polymorphic toxin-type HINT domain-containing protein [Streptomyces sp. SID8352]|uniref:polymorphic toxin-type HINT domain-containing protein n=1 Tax=Streptomyces sp. SID8352 TaxID=2690338 RepID=UPI00137020CB|nr:polymorphic toxin-type HINT domain-containing protein [Streptomyces sp. SID8352]MYU21839.1 RHS repeat-associated core domain-containing protein [Streptomyces sp. SID8352]
MSFGIYTSQTGRRRWHAARRGRGRLLAQSLVLALVVPTGLAQVAQAAEPEGLDRPGIPASPVTKVRAFDTTGANAARTRADKERAANERQAERAGKERRAGWPGGGSATVTLKPGAHRGAEPGGLPVSLVPAAAPASRAAAAPSAAGEARVTVLDQKAARAAGVTGVLLTASAGSPGTARVRVDYGGFASAIGGGWAQRLRLVRLPDCALTTPGRAQCREQTPLASDNSLAGRTVSATVPLGAAPGASAARLTGGADTASGATVLAVTAAPAGGGQSPKGTGDYSATKLAESSSWQAGSSSGSFTWSYDFTMPPPAAGPVPPLTLSYDSGGVDGRTATSNNQTTTVGEGFGLTESYIERTYQSCDDDGHADVFDKCWKYDNARLVLNGRSTRLIKDNTSGVWHLENDDASTVTRSTGAVNGDDDGEYWTVVTGDGTTYVFGRNKLDGAADQRTNSTWTVPVFGDDSGEPGYSAGSAFANRSLTQAWRWNLDYVEDTGGNAATYWYTKESNYYKKNKSAKASASYTRGGYLARIEYGLRKGALFTDQADAKVTFTHAERCTAADCTSLTKATSENWPDVPFDAICAKDADTCDSAGPSFFSRKRLTGISTFSLNATTSAYDPVDSWSLTEAFLDGGDIGDSSDQVLTLKSLKRTAKAGDTSIALEPISFTYQLRPNRVDGTDDILPLTRPRISTITSETGAITEVTLSAPECRRSEVLGASPDSNTRSCYPQFWHINGAQDAAIDWFHKYRVTAVGVHDAAATNPAVEYAYSYSGAAWHHNDEPFIPSDERTWSDWRGYRQVTAYTGAAGGARSKTVSLYLQGMHGDKNKDGTTKSVSVAPLLDTDVDFVSVTDSDRYKGALRQQLTYNGSQPIESVFHNYTYKNTATQTVPGAAAQPALWVRPSSVYTSTYLTGSQSWRTAVTSQSYDDLGMVVSADDFGQRGLSGDEACTLTWYARNPALGITSLVSRTRTVAKQCSTAEASLNLPTGSGSAGDVLSDTAAVYDSPTATAWSATQTPTKGHVTWAGRATGYAATAGTDGRRAASGWQTVSTTTYDTLGRPLTVTDTAGRTTSTAYTPEDAGPLTRTITTDPKEFRTVSYIDPRRGLPLRVYDPNLKKTEQQYDALGRVTDVWLPNRSAGVQTPNLKFGYLLRKTGPSWVSTGTLKNDGETFNTSYAIYDSLFRPLQTQSPTPQGGRLLTDTRYDTRGLAHETYADIFDNTKTPNSTYTRAEYGRAPRQAETVFDGAGRPTVSTLYVNGTKKWSTTTSHTGDSTATTGLTGGSAQRTVTDIRGRTVETRSYAGVNPADADFGTGPGVSHRATKFTYAVDGRQKGITGPDGAQWAYGYDLFGRRTSAQDPDTGTSTTQYDTLDRVTGTTDSRGKTVLSAYDEADRVTGTWAGSRTDANQLTGFTYDTLLKGLPSTSTRYVGGKNGAAYTQAVTAYDSMSRAIKSELRLPASDPFVVAGQPATLAFETHYNIPGQVQQTKAPALGGLASEILGLEYDGLGNLTEIGVYLSAIDYSALGQPQMLTRGTGADRVYVANSFEEGTGRLTRSYTQDLTHPYQLQDLNYSYDQTGNVTSIGDPTTLGGTSSAETQCFAYDAHQRLTEAWTPSSRKCADARSATALSGPAPYWTSYTYNTAGQRTTETQHTGTGNTQTTYCYTSTAQPHTLTGTTTGSGCASPQRTYTYDTTGNTTKRPGVANGSTQSLTWSDEGRLSRLTEGGKSTDYLYGADGNLLIRATQNGERVLYAGSTELHLRANGTTWAQRYYAADGITAGLRTNQTGTEKITFLTGNHHGTSSLAIERLDQQFTKRYSTPFGADRGTPQFGPWPDDKGFLGKTRDTTTGLTHIGARQYDPSIGQFISVDPVLSPEQPESMNGYSYANNSPVSMSDPDGLRPIGLCEYGCQDGSYTYRDWLTPSANGTWKPHYEYISYNYTAAGDLHSVIREGPDQPSGSGKTKFKSYDFKTQKKVTGVATSLLPDPREWYRCGSGDGTKHCVNSAMDLPMAKPLKFIPDSAVKKGTNWVDDLIKGNKKCNRCFLAGTDVLMADGSTKDIEDVRVGDKVLATDPATGETAARQVTHLIITEDDKQFNELSIATPDGIDKLTATHEHPFWSPSERDWIPAGRLKPGMTLRTDTGETVIVTGNRPYTDHARTYNLTVDDLHTYYVLAGETPVLVHNSNGCPNGKLSDPLPQGMSRHFVNAYDEIRAGRGVPQTDPATGAQKVFQGRATHEKRWAGALEYRVPGSKGDSARILAKTLPDGRVVMGWTNDHYKTIKPFSAPHFPDSGW